MYILRENTIRMFRVVESVSRIMLLYTKAIDHALGNIRRSIDKQQMVLNHLLVYLVISLCTCIYYYVY